jgi:sulfoxide reductase heme-binding subunit YedZ
VTPIVADKAIWYVMRSTGIVSLLLLSAVAVLGIATVQRWGPRALPRFVTVSLHRSISLLAVVFVAIHVATAVLDPYAGVSVAAVVVPFVAHARPFWVGLGTVSLDVTAALVVTSLVRDRLAPRVWRAVHWLAYLAWPTALAHALGTGTDASSLWLRGLAASCVLAVGAALAWRLLGSASGKRLERQPVPA